jgi:hypothetical protein
MRLKRRRRPHNARICHGAGADGDATGPVLLFSLALLCFILTAPLAVKRGVARVVQDSTCSDTNMHYQKAYSFILGTVLVNHFEGTLMSSMHFRGECPIATGNWFEHTSAKQQ